MNSPIFSLPREIVELIANFLDAPTQSSLAKASRHFYWTLLNQYQWATTQHFLSRVYSAGQFSDLLNSLPNSRSVREEAFVKFGQKIYRLPGNERRAAFNAWNLQFLSLKPRSEIGTKLKVLSAKGLRGYILAPYDEIMAGGDIDDIIKQFDLSETKQMLLHDISFQWGFREMFLWYMA